MEEVLKQILSRLDGIDHRLGSLEEGQKNLEAGQARIEKKLDATFERVGENTEAITDINNKLSGELKLEFLKAE